MKSKLPIGTSTYLNRTPPINSFTCKKMGPGSESMVTSYSQVQQNSPSIHKGKKGKNGSKDGSSSCTSTHVDESRSGCVYSSDEAGKPHHKKSGKRQTQNQHFSSSYPQYHSKSKPIPVKRSFSHNEVEGGKPTRSLPGGGGKQQHQLLSTVSPVKGTYLPTPYQRPSSLTPPAMASHSLISPSPLKGTPGKSFYAGAKFETNPSCMVLPLPPTHWTTPIQRSQSQPSTPTIKSAPNGTQFTPIDLVSLFGSPATIKPVTMAKSFRGEAMMQASVKKTLESDSSDEELKEILNEGTKKADIVIDKKEAVPIATTVLKASPRKAVNTEDLKKALGMIATNSPSTSVNTKVESASDLDLTCHGSVTPLKHFKEMSDQLKSLMKVAA